MPSNEFRSALRHASRWATTSFAAAVLALPSALVIPCAVQPTRCSAADLPNAPSQRIDGPHRQVGPSRVQNTSGPTGQARYTGQKVVTNGQVQNLPTAVSSNHRTVDPSTAPVTAPSGTLTHSDWAQQARGTAATQTQPPRAAQPTDAEKAWQRMSPEERAVNSGGWWFQNPSGGTQSIQEHTSPGAQVRTNDYLGSRFNNWSNISSGQGLTPGQGPAWSNVPFQNAGYTAPSSYFAGPNDTWQNLSQPGAFPASNGLYNFGP